MTDERKHIPPILESNRTNLIVLGSNQRILEFERQGSIGRVIVQFRSVCMKARDNLAISCNYKSIKATPDYMKKHLYGHT
jgi:hypothetical protein